jgi:serine protease Do
VVGVKVLATEDARSAETLGLRRAGSGVLISQDGLILTIGYLMLEAEQIEIVTQDNRTLPARAVAYDLATGFGLLRPLLPLRGVAVAALGSSRDLQPGEPLMAVTGPQADDDGDVSMTRLVSRRAFSGSWEYHIESALFTSPPVLASGGNHSGAPLFNQRGELMGIGSLFVSDATGENRRLPGNMFVPVDLLRPILAELQRAGLQRQEPQALAGHHLQRPGRAHPDPAGEQGKPGGPGRAGPATWCWRWTMRKSRRWRRSTKSSGTMPRPTRKSGSRCCRAPRSRPSCCAARTAC